jgi:hypothetical protein
MLSANLFWRVLGLVALLALAAPAAQATPLDQDISYGPYGWVELGPTQWDPSRPWYQRGLVIRPPLAVDQPLLVTVEAPGPEVHPLSDRAFVLAQDVIVPSLTQVLPPYDLYHEPFRMVQVDPSLYVLSHPSVYCTLSTAFQCQRLAQQLAAWWPGYTSMNYNGPLGSGVYLAYHGALAAAAPAAWPTAVNQASSYWPYGWAAVGPTQWDPDRAWYQRSAVIRPPFAVDQPLLVSVTVPGPTVHPVTDRAFVLAEDVIMPSLTQLLSVQNLYYEPLRMVQVDPSRYVLAHPSLYCTVETAYQCQALAQQLAARWPGYAYMSYDGPLGSGVYLSYQG